MRLFVCSFLADSVQEFYRDHFAEPIAMSGGLLRSIPPGSAHLTYAFIGYVPDTSLSWIIDAIGAVAARHDPIEIRLGAPVIQYARGRPKLVYAPLIEGTAAMTNLTHDISRGLGRVAGLGHVDSSRSPHVTLARFHKQMDRRAALLLLDTLSRNRIGDVVREDRIGEVQVVSSELTPAGPRYDIKARLRLRD